MNPFTYYFELLDKPKYMLSSSEQMFLDVFEFVMIAVICAIILIIICVVCAIVDKFKKGK